MDVENKVEYSQPRIFAVTESLHDHENKIIAQQPDILESCRLHAFRNKVSKPSRKSDLIVKMQGAAKETCLGWHPCLRVRAKAVPFSRPLPVAVTTMLQNRHSM